MKMSSNSENLRCVHLDLESLYDMSAEVDQLKLFISRKTQFRLQNDDVQIFVSLKGPKYTLACSVIGVPETDPFESQKKYYLRDYGFKKIHRERLGPLIAKDFTEMWLLNTINPLFKEISNKFALKTPLVRVIFKDWGKDFKNSSKIQVIVDFFLD